MRRSLALALLVACGSPAPTPPARITAAIVPATANRSVDVLFLIDDSIGLDMEVDFINAFPAFLDVLGRDGLPSLHLGVATSDLGTSAVGDAMPGPTIPGSVGGCSGSGKDGELQTNGNTVVTGRFIVDDGATKNYTGTLADAFKAIASVGAAGCGFEQTLEAVHHALVNTTTNAGFLRPDANLAVIVLTDEDDCSLEHTALIDPTRTDLGPLQSFRCTRYGVTCDVGGTTPDEMNVIGVKDACHSNEQSPYLTHIADYATFLRGLKPDPRMVMFAAVAGDPAPFEVEGRTPNGSMTVYPALRHSCNYTAANNSLVVADPAVRIYQLASLVERNVTSTVCTADFAPTQAAIAREINSMMGSPCLTRDIVLPADCVATDDAGPVTDFSIVEDDALCPDGQHLKLQRGGTPAGATTVRCTPG